VFYIDIKASTKGYIKMEKLIIMITLVIILFITKKNYRELLVFLAISLIIDWIFVNIFSTIPLIRVIAISVGNPILSVLIYTVIELICMGIFYYVLKKYNYIISLIVYSIIKLIIKLIINEFYMSITGTIILDLLFNFIIGIIIIIAYRKSIVMEDIKWFAIIGMIIDTILTFCMAHLWRIVGGTIFIYIWIYIWIYGTLFMPYIIGIILSTIIICLIRKRLINKDKEFRIFIYAMIIVICGYVSVKAGYAFLSYESARPDKLYTEMKEINDNQSLIGLSKEEVIGLLGNPYNGIDTEDKSVFEYDAGKISNRLFFGESNFYKFIIVFDENDKVKSTSIKMFD